MGLRSVTIMGDSKTVIKKCQTIDMDKSIIGPVIRDIQKALIKWEERNLVRDERICNEGALEEEWSRNPD
ncbi:hypothetical protein Godav_023039 [Gossypium davidsonii]|uniref:RNase H type-1 domain-containing protein n=1 Tax=Gossypium davidsonii TaxID=34287 RepID=A0A7J8SQC0_GOSDV|nr:hypothetical protein [Gossypium davidsonii]